MIFGIDFGTSNTVASVHDASVMDVSARGASARGGDGKARILELPGQGEVVPSLMYFERSGAFSIGREAMADYSTSLAGARAGDVRGADFRFFQGLKFALRDRYFTGTKLFGRRWSIEQLVGAYLRRLRELAEEAAGEGPELLVMGRPVVLCDDLASEAAILERYREAARIAGFPSVRFVMEPVAAMSDIARAGTEGLALVFDFGGGTLDITVAELSKGDFRVLSSVGADLGGYRLNEDISRARVIGHFGYGSTFRTMTGRRLEIPAWVTNQVASFYALPLADVLHTKAVIKDMLFEADKKGALLGLLDFLSGNRWYELFERIDDAKIELSSAGEASIRFDLPPNVSVDEALSRPDFERIVEPRIEEARALVRKALSEAGVAAADLSRVVRVGGSSRVPAFVRMLEAEFPGRVREGEVFTSIASGLIPAHLEGRSIA
jgi:Molecular chaperone